MADPLMVRARPPRATAVALLEIEGLPVSDLTDAHLEHFFFVGSDGAPAGLVGLEFYGNDALLRSLAVTRSERNCGLARALVEHAEGYAASRAIRAIYLLTTTADRYFERLGYRRLDRTGAPVAIRSSPEFASLCPASSVFMGKVLNVNG